MLNVLVVFFRIICLNSLENEELILHLLVHNQVLATYDSKPVLILGFLDSDDLVGLSGVACQEFNGDLSALL